jgi:hypothetical protein
MTKDGQTTPTANIPLGNNKIINLGNGTAATDAAAFGQLQAGTEKLITVSGTDTITGTMNPTLTAYATGNMFSFVPANTNTGPATININSLGAKSIKKNGSTALAAGDIVSGSIALIEYDGTNFQLLNSNSFVNLTVTGNETVNGNETVGGTLGVTGATTLSSTLGVTGATTLSAALTYGGVTLTNAVTGTGKMVLDTSPTITTPTVTNPTVTNYVESVVAIGTVTSTNTIALTNGTVQTATLTASTACTFTMPTATAGKSFVLLLKQAASTGNGSATFTGVKWGTAGAPTITVTAGKMDILTFIADGTNWYGSIAQGYTP